MGSARHDSRPRRFPRGGGVPAPQSLVPATPLVLRGSWPLFTGWKGDCRDGGRQGSGPQPPTPPRTPHPGPRPEPATTPTLCRVRSDPQRETWERAGLRLGRAHSRRGRSHGAASLAPEVPGGRVSVSLPLLPAPRLSVVTRGWGAARVCFPWPSASGRHPGRAPRELAEEKEAERADPSPQRPGPAPRAQPQVGRSGGQPLSQVCPHPLVPLTAPF